MTFLGLRKHQPDAWHRIGLAEPQGVKMQRHRETYAALNELVDVLGISFDRTPAFAEGIGIEDFIQSVGDVARAAKATLRSG